MHQGPMLICSMLFCLFFSLVMRVLGGEGEMGTKGCGRETGAVLVLVAVHAGAW